jgi:hypothetical protein
MDNLERLNEYNNIINAWNNDDILISDIYYMIVYFLEKYQDTLKAINDVNNIFTRMNNGESMNDIVEDFVCDNYYIVLKTEIKKI